MNFSESRGSKEAARVAVEGHTERRTLEPFYAVGLRIEPAHLVRGSSRRITIMRFRPADIRVIDRRDSRLDRDSRPLPRGPNTKYQLTGRFISEGLFLVRVERAFYRWHPQKPFFALRLAILEPKEHTGQAISGRLYCTPKALWKLSWFLRDFGYDPDLLGRDEVDEKALLGLCGVARVSRTTLNGRSFLNLEGFAPAGEWEELSVATVGSGESPEASDDL